MMSLVQTWESTRCTKPDSSTDAAWAIVLGLKRLQAGASSISVQPPGVTAVWRIGVLEQVMCDSFARSRTQTCQAELCRSAQT